MKSPQFSIIVPAYNRAKILPRTIASVQAQTFPDWELIIIDDGSIDETESVVKNLIASDSRIQYYWQENAERSAARNHGIRKSSGEYICFLDSDDEYLPAHLQSLADAISTQKSKEALFFTNGYIQYENGERSPFRETKRAEEPWPFFIIRHSIIPARVCIHHGILQKFNFREDIVIVEDTVLWTTIAMHFPIVQVSSKSILYHWHDDNSVNIRKNCFEPRIRGLKKFFNDKNSGKKIPNSIKRDLLSGCYYGIARHFEWKRDYFRMSYNLIKSILQKPGDKQTKAKIYTLIAYWTSKKNGD